MENIHHQIESEWNLCGNLIKDFVNIVVREFKTENHTNDDIDVLLEKVSEDLLVRICRGMEYHLGAFGISNLKICMKSWISQSIDEEIERRVKENGGSTNNETVQTNLANVNMADGGLNYIQ